MADQRRRLTKLKDQVEQAQRDSIEYKMRVKSASERLYEDYKIAVSNATEAEKYKKRLEEEIGRQTSQLNKLIAKIENLTASAEDKIRAR